MRKINFSVIREKNTLFGQSERQAFFPFQKKYERRRSFGLRPQDEKLKRYFYSLINKGSHTFFEFFASRIYKLAFFIILCFVLVAYSQEKKETNKKESVVITADKLEYFNKDKMAIYTGKVEAIKGNIKLNADMMKIFLDDKGDVSKIIATGNVYFEQENKWGKGKEAEYYKDKNLIILRNNAEVHQDKNVVEGDEIYYYIDEEKAMATSKTKRVRSIIFPKEKQQ